MKKFPFYIITCLIVLSLLSCEDELPNSGADLSGDETAFGTSLDELGAYDGYFEDDSSDVEIKCVSGSDACYTIQDGTLHFSDIQSDSVYSVSGKLFGNIIIDAGEYKFDLEMHSFSLVADKTNPITILSGDEVTLTAKKDTKNYIYDMRESIDSADESLKSGAIHSECDLEIAGKGELTLLSENNNGIHSKDDIEVKNLNLEVISIDNALKGNDSVSVNSATLMLIAKGGDGIKTKNSDISEKGNQRGDISISNSCISIYAACDGIDASHDVKIDTDSTVLNIYTNKYSAYTEESLIFVEDENEDITTVPEWDFDLGFGFQRPGGKPGGGHGGDFGGFGGGGDFGGHGGMGGINDGNTDKSEYSAKGIKAANEIEISGGTVTVKSYDDAIHANGGEALENGEIGLGNISVTGGSVSLYSNDDAMHADSALDISGGKISVLHSYEGLEGGTVGISGGDLSIFANDDGINSTAAYGNGITISGGEIYIFSSGDGIDSNTTSAYSGIIFSGAKVTVISTSGGNSAIDTEHGYTYEGGSILAIMPSGGMSGEATNTQNFSLLGTTASLNISAEETLIASANGEAHEVKIPIDMRATVIYLGSANAEIRTK